MHLEKILPLALPKIMWLIKITVFTMTVLITLPIILVGLYLELEERIDKIHY